MWRRLAAVMRFEGFGSGTAASKHNPLTARATVSGSPLEEIAFDPNPGNLRMFGFVPAKLKPGAALVVILHGCGQTAAGYDMGTGWSTLARSEGFAVLAPEQKAMNNPGTCFNWFTPGDIARGEGEAASIAAMIHTMVETHKIDPSRVFITGLSAGGAMTAAMLASYPERFAAGAIIAGLPFGGAANVKEALDAMRSPPSKAPREWGALVRAASPARHNWPRIAIWHGDADTTVALDNAKALTAQWRDVMDLKLADAKQDTVDGATRLMWDNRLQVVTVPGLAHGTPIDSSDLGMPLPFILDAGISSTRRIAEFFGLTAAAETATPKPRAKPKPAPALQASVLQTIETTLAANLPPAPALENFLRRALKRVWKR